MVSCRALPMETGCPRSCWSIVSLSGVAILPNKIPLVFLKTLELLKFLQRRSLITRSKSTRLQSNAVERGVGSRCQQIRGCAR